VPASDPVAAAAPNSVLVDDRWHRSSSVALRVGHRAPIPRIYLPCCASRAPPGIAFLSFSDSIRSAQHVEETCIDCPSAACCQSPRSRAMPACGMCCVAHRRTGPAFAESIVVDRIHCLPLVGAKRFLAPRTRLCRLLWLPCRPMTRSRVPVCACLSTRTTSANCTAILFAPFFSPAAPAVRLPYRDVSANGEHIPPPPSPLNRPQCVGLHATVPASFAERVRPCVFESLRAVPELSAVRLDRLNTQIRAKPPANPMDIACPGSSIWATVDLI
jgi:hypothetical protein